jgi:hypothetical protein
MNRRPAAAALIVAAGATLLAAGTPLSIAGASGQTFTVYAFGVAPERANLIAAPGTDPHKPAAGDYTVVDDQITSTTRQPDSGYKIIGHDAGTCTYTRVHHNGNALASCVDTVVIRGSSLFVQGILTAKAGVPQTSVAGVLGGTGRYSGATGTLRVSFGKNHNTYTFSLT